MGAAYTLVLWLHVLVMGYWIGTDLVINALAHYAIRARAIPGAERGRLWDFLMHVDQHPRNALILSLPLGLTLAAMLGLSPIAGPWLALAWLASAAWFAQMWLVHLRGHTPAGPALRRWDWRIRYLLIAACVASALASFAWGVPFAAHWLALKVLLYGGVIGCGLGIRHQLVQFFALWPLAVAGTASDADEAELARTMRAATWVLALLHAQLLAIALLGLYKPF